MNQRRAAWLALALALASLCALPRAGQASAQAKSGSRSDKLSPDLRERLRASHGAQDRVEVVIQLDGDEGGQLRAFLNRNGVHVKGQR